MALFRPASSAPLLLTPASRRAFLRSSLAVGAAGMLSGCGGATAARIPTTAGGATVVRYQGWPNTVLNVELAENLGYLDGVDLQWVGSTSSGPQDIQSVATGAADLGYAFTGAVIKLVEAGAAVTAVSNYYGPDTQTFHGLYVGEASDIRDPPGPDRPFRGDEHPRRPRRGLRLHLAAAGRVERGGDRRGHLRRAASQRHRPGHRPRLRRRRGPQRHRPGRGLTQGGLRELVRDTDLFGPFAAGQAVLRDDWIDTNPEAAATGISRAIDWATTRPREEVIARYTEIVTGRARQEKTEPLQYWKSSGLVAVGRMRNEDFTRWQDWLQATRIVEGDLDPAKYYTNDLISSPTAASA